METYASNLNEKKSKYEVFVQKTSPTDNPLDVKKKSNKLPTKEKGIKIYDCFHTKSENLINRCETEEGCEKTKSSYK